VILFFVGFAAGLVGPSFAIWLAVRDRNRARREATDACARAEALANEATAHLIGRGEPLRVGFVAGEVVLLMRRGAA
jgi:hypothetical protein